MPQQNYSIFIPLKVDSEQNKKEHWAVSNKRHQLQKLVVKQYLSTQSKITLPCTIILTRIAPRKMDTDNMIFGFKFIKDAVAEWIHPGLATGRADDDPNITWLYDQEKGKPKQYAIRIEIF